MRNRLTKQAMGKNDSPTTMHVEHANPEVSKYETGDPSSWGEDVNMDSPWDLENSKGREETNHVKKVRESTAHNTYASAVKEAQELESKALRCLKMAEVFLGDEAPTDVIERQAVDFMSMSNKSVLATLRRMREFEENINEARVAKIVDAVLEAISEEDCGEEEKEDKKSSEQDEDSKISAIVEATLEVIAEEKEEEEKKEVEKKEAAKEEVKEEKEEEMKEEKKEASKEDALVNKITAAVLAALSVKSEEKKEEKEEMKEEMKEEKEEEKKEEKEEEMKEAAKEEKKEEKEEEMKEAAKEEKKEEKEEEMKEAAKEEKKEEKEEVKEATEISFEDGMDVTASDEDAALLAQLFSTKESSDEDSVKESKIKTLKNVTASNGASEIDRLASLWSKN